MKYILLFLFICVTQETQASINDYIKIINQHENCCKKAYQGAQLNECKVKMKNEITSSHIEQLFFENEGEEEENINDLIDVMNYACDYVVAINNNTPLQVGAFVFLAISSLFPPDNRTSVDDYMKKMISSYGSDLTKPMFVGAEWWQFLLHNEPDFLNILTDSNKAEFKEYLTNKDFKNFYYNYREVIDNGKAKNCYITHVLSVWKANEKQITEAATNKQKTYIIPSLFGNC